MTSATKHPSATERLQQRLVGFRAALADLDPEAGRLIRADKPDLVEALDALATKRIDLINQLATAERALEMASATESADTASDNRAALEKHKAATLKLAQDRVAAAFDIDTKLMDLRAAFAAFGEVDRTLGIMASRFNRGAWRTARCTPRLYTELLRQMDRQDIGIDPRAELATQLGMLTDWIAEFERPPVANEESARD